MKGLTRAVTGLTGALLLFAAGCTAGEAAETATRQITVESVSLQHVTPIDGVRLEVAPQGNRARYMVREQLAGFDLPNDAVGVTEAVSGAIVLNGDGSIDAGASRIVVDVSGLKSDSDRRDGFVARRLLLVEDHPNVTLRPVAFSGLSLPLPTSGARSFELRGDLTVLETTRPTVWRVNAFFSENGVTGTAETAFTFADFGMTQPRVPIVLSVADTIRLEYVFNLVQSQ